MLLILVGFFLGFKHTLVVYCRHLLTVETRTHFKKRENITNPYECLKFYKMKRQLLLLCLAYVAITAYGQTAIPNGNFETWNSITYDYPQNYPYNSNYDVLYRYQSALSFNVEKTTPSYHGSNAIKLTTVASGTETAIGYFINTNPNNGNPDTWTGGMPYTQKPNGIRGYYKYNVATGDSALIFAVFSKGGVNIGTYMFTIGDVHTDFTLFNFTLNPPLAEAPDSVIFAATSSNIMVNENGVAGSVLILDSVSFTGVASQPTEMNGDFETWESQTIYNPADWYISGESTGTMRTTDAFKGDYAIELKTYLGTDQNSNPIARAGQIATGYYPRNCGGNCNELGGFPFTNQVDTLAFWYKYSPSSDDSAVVYLNFKKNGTTFFGAQKILPASAEYQYVEMPFNAWQAPDTVIVNIQSSYWYDTLVTSAGSTLIVDEIQFKSQPILYASLPVFASKDQLSVYPNPSGGKFRIRNDAGINQIIVYNMLGKMMYSKNNFSGSKLNEIDLTKFQKGVYFIEIYDNTKMHTEKIVIR